MRFIDASAIARAGSERARGEEEKCIFDVAPLFASCTVRKFHALRCGASEKSQDAHSLRRKKAFAYGVAKP